MKLEMFDQEFRVTIGGVKTPNDGLSRQLLVVIWSNDNLVLDLELLLMDYQKSC